MYQRPSYTTVVLLLSLVVLTYARASAAQSNTEGKVTYDFCGQLSSLDSNYCYFNKGIDSTANTINNWSKHDGGNNDTPATTNGTLRFGWEPRSGDFSEVDFRFKVRVKLPALKDRVELLLSDREDDVDDQVVKAARNGELGNRDKTVLALQYKNEEADKTSYRIGFGRGSQLYTRARYSDKFNFTPDSALRYFVETNYYSSDKLGFEANAEYGYVIDSNSAFELNNSFRYRTETRDWLWRHEFQLLHLGKNDTSYLFTASIDGTSRPSYNKNKMLVSMRYKQKILREWLFIEIEPFVIWRKEEMFRASIGLAVRTEIHFST